MRVGYCVVTFMHGKSQQNPVLFSRSYAACCHNGTNDTNDMNDTNGTNDTNSRKILSTTLLHRPRHCVASVALIILVKSSLMIMSILDQAMIMILHALTLAIKFFCLILFRQYIYDRINNQKVL